MNDEYFTRFFCSLAIGAPLSLPLMAGCLNANSTPDGIETHASVLPAAQPRTVDDKSTTRSTPTVKIQNAPALNDTSSVDRGAISSPHASTIESLAPKKAQRIVLAHEAPPVLAGTQVEHCFRFTNPTLAALAFVGEKAMQVSCGCTHANVKTVRLAPGGQGEIQLAIDTQGKTGAISESVIALWNNDADETLAVSCSLSTVVQSAIDTVPRELVFDRLSITKSRLATIHIRSDRDLQWDAADCTVTEPFVQIRDRDFDPDRKLLTLKLKCLPVNSGRSRQAQLRIRIPEDQGKLHTKLVPIFAADTTLLRATPPILMFPEIHNRPNDSLTQSSDNQPAGVATIEKANAVSSSTPDAAPTPAALQDAHTSARLIITGQAVAEGEQVDRVDSNLAKLAWSAKPLGKKAIKLVLTVPVDVLSAASSNHPSQSGGPRITIRMSRGSKLSVPISLK